MTGLRVSLLLLINIRLLFVLRVSSNWRLILGYYTVKLLALVPHKRQVHIPATGTGSARTY